MASRIFPQIAIASIVAVLMLQTQPALGMGQTLKRSTENLTQGPLDFGLQPISSTVTFTKGFLLSEDFSTPVKVLGAPIIFPVLTLYCGFVTTFTSVWRTVEGAVVFPFGLGYLFTDKDIIVTFQNPKSAPALVNHETEFFWFNFGNRYCEEN